MKMPIGASCVESPERALTADDHRWGVPASHPVRVAEECAHGRALGVSRGTACHIVSAGFTQWTTSNSGRTHDLGYHASLMPKNKLSRLHVTIEPPVTAMIGDRCVTFVGINLLNKAVIVEYEVEPPLTRSEADSNRLLVLTVTDDVSEQPYPTAWEDFHEWREQGPNRVTTRLDRRPAAAARRLHFEVRPADAFAPRIPGPGSVRMRSVAHFDIDLPVDHGSPSRTP